MNALGQARRHLVLGGSAGIGYAYAERQARLGENLIIVARDSTRLGETRQRLLSAGARSVEARSSDLADPDARAALLDRLARETPFSTIFVGGPGPVAGRADEVSDEDHDHARQVCLDYPCDLFDRATELIEAGGRLVLLSSSAADEPLEGHRFYLSALYRRRLDAVRAKAAEVLHAAGIEVLVLKPKVVLTALSDAFARTIDGSRSAAAVLAEYFLVPNVQSPGDFLQDSGVPEATDS